MAAAVSLSGMESVGIVDYLMEIEKLSLEEARRWVFPPDRSMHVQGLAIDVPICAAEHPGYAGNDA